MYPRSWIGVPMSITRKTYWFSGKSSQHRITIQGSLDLKQRTIFKSLLHANNVNNFSCRRILGRLHWNREMSLVSYDLAIQHAVSVLLAR